MLSANPKGTSPLRLDKEQRKIEAGLMERSRFRDQFRLITKVAVRPRDLQRATLDYAPQVVHFSGHGSGEQGLVLEDEIGQTQFVSADAVVSLFKLHADRLQCVLLNACYSTVQAEAIALHIPYVIGMSDAIGDCAAIEFAVAFYDALGAGQDVKFAYKNACVAIKLAGIPQDHIPVLHERTESSLPSEFLPTTIPQMYLSHNLTDKQLDLLKWLVNEVRANKLDAEEMRVYFDLFYGQAIVTNYKGGSPSVMTRTGLAALQNDNCIVINNSNGVLYIFCLTRRAYEIVDSDIEWLSKSRPQTPTMNPKSMPINTSSIPESQPLSVFVSYSHEDEDFKDKLLTHLASLKRQGKVRTWQDRDIEAGSEWDSEIKHQLETAEVILLLITPRFIASDYCYDLEMQRAIERHNEGSARVIPIIVKPCDWQGSPFSKLQLLPKDAKAITKWNDQDEAFLNVVQGIRRTVDSLQAGQLKK